MDINARNAHDHLALGRGWANASSTPFRLYKHFAHEGGAATPFFLHWPAGIKPRREWYQDSAQLIDLMPTILDLAGGRYPTKMHGNPIPTVDGISLRPAFNFQPLGRKKPLFIEHENHAFVREGDWKLVGERVSPAGGLNRERWELYNLREDRSELNNLAAVEKARVARMSQAWERWAARAGVFPKKK